MRDLGRRRPDPSGDGGDGGALGDSSSSRARVQVMFNTTSQEQVFEVPESFRDVLPARLPAAASRSSSRRRRSTASEEADPTNDRRGLRLGADLGLDHALQHDHADRLLLLQRRRQRQPRRRSASRAPCPPDIQASARCRARSTWASTRLQRARPGGDRPRDAARCRRGGSIPGIGSPPARCWSSTRLQRQPRHDDDVHDPADEAAKPTGDAAHRRSSALKLATRQPDRLRIGKVTIGQRPAPA